MNGDPDEQGIADGLRQGSAEAWRALYDAQAERVWRLVARLMGAGRSEVADVVQETFLAAARGASSFDPQRGTLAAWLSGIARRQMALYYRKQQQVSRLEQAAHWLAGCNGEVLDWLGGRQKPPPEVLEAKELRLLVRATLSDLPSGYGDLLAAKYIDEVSMEELAEAENSSTAAISSKLARARRAFREAFCRSST